MLYIRSSRDHNYALPPGGITQRISVADILMARISRNRWSYAACSCFDFTNDACRWPFPRRVSHVSAVSIVGRRRYAAVFRASRRQFPRLPQLIIFRRIFASFKIACRSAVTGQFRYYCSSATVTRPSNATVWSVAAASSPKSGQLFAAARVSLLFRHKPVRFRRRFAGFRNTISFARWFLYRRSSFADEYCASHRISLEISPRRRRRAFATMPPPLLCTYERLPQGVASRHIYRIKYYMHRSISYFADKRQAEN